MSDIAQNNTKTYDIAKTPFSWDKLDGLLAHKSSIIMCSEILSCPESTIRHHIKKRFNVSFKEYAEQKLSVTKLKLVQKALQQAQGGNTVMLIFCLKNLCKWQDKIEQEIKGGSIEIKIDKNDNQL